MRFGPAIALMLTMALVHAKEGEI
jgi:hypothetical protein